MVLARPGGMRGGAGVRLEGGLRYTKDLCFRFDTPALLYETCGGLFNRSAHSAGPVKGIIGLWDYFRNAVFFLFFGLRDYPKNLGNLIPHRMG